MRIQRRNRLRAVGTTALVLAITLGAGCKKGLREVPAVLPSRLIAEIPAELRTVPDPQAVKGGDFVRAAAQVMQRIRESEGGGSMPDLGDLLENLLLNEEDSANEYQKRLIALIDKREVALKMVLRALESPLWSPPPSDPDTLANAVILRRDPGQVQAMGRIMPFIRGYEGRAEIKRLKQQPGIAEDLLLALELCDRLCGGGFSIHHLSGLRGETVALRTIQSFVNRRNMPDSELRKLFDGIKLRTDTSRLIGTYRHELNEFIPYYVASSPLGGNWGGEIGTGGEGGPDDVETLSRLFAGHPDPFDRLATMRLFVGAYREMIRRASLPWSASKGPLGFVRVNLPLPLDGSDSMLELEQARLKSEQNPYGRHLLEMIVPIAKQLAELERRGNIERVATRTIIAVEMYRRQFGKRPSQIEDLVRAGFLSELPRETFGNTPITITRNGRGLQADSATAKKGQSGSLWWPIDGRYPRMQFQPMLRFNPRPPGGIDPRGPTPLRSGPSMNLQERRTAP